MKKLLFLSAMTVLLSGTTLMAQEKMLRENAEEIQTQRKKFYERELQFSEAESKVFWPIFESHQAQMKQLKDKKNRPKLELMSDAEAEAFLDSHFEQEEQILAARKSLVQSLKGKFGIRKIALLSQTEHKFKKELLRHFKRERGQERQGGERNREHRGGEKNRF